MTGFFWIIIIISVVTCALIAGGVFPKVFFRSGADLRSGDRGLKRYRGKGTRTVICQPEVCFREYISQYALSESKGIKSIVCKKGGADFYDIDFDVVAYDENDRIINILNITENIGRTGHTKSIRVPSQTTYVSIKINSYDGIELKDEQTEKKSEVIFKKQFGLYYLCVTALLILEEFIIKLCLAQIYGGLFKSGFLLSPLNIMLTVVIGIVAAAVCTVLVHLYIMFTKKKSGGKV